MGVFLHIQGGAIKGDVLAFFEVHDTTFTDNRATQSLGGAIAVVGT
jgi:predicted outer membrane repeat protein